MPPFLELIQVSQNLPVSIFGLLQQVLYRPAAFLLPFHHTHCFNGHFPGEPGLPSCPVGNNFYVWDALPLTKLNQTNSIKALMYYPVASSASSNHCRNISCANNWKLVQNGSNKFELSKIVNCSHSCNKNAVVCFYGCFRFTSVNWLTVLHCVKDKRRSSQSMKISKLRSSVWMDLTSTI